MKRDHACATLCETDDCERFAVVSFLPDDERPLHACYQHALCFVAGCASMRWKLPRALLLWCPVNSRGVYVGGAP